MSDVPKAKQPSGPCRQHHEYALTGKLPNHGKPAKPAKTAKKP